MASTHKGAWILDPFAGSSTTGIAANLLNRKYLGIDKEREYLTISENRKHEIENLEMAERYTDKIQDISLYNRISADMADELETEGYDLPF